MSNGGVSLTSASVSSSCPPPPLPSSSSSAAAAETASGEKNEEKRENTTFVDSRTSSLPSQNRQVEEEEEREEERTEERAKAPQRTCLQCQRCNKSKAVAQTSDAEINHQVMSLPQHVTLNLHKVQASSPAALSGNAIANSQSLFSKTTGNAQKKHEFSSFC